MAKTPEINLRNDVSQVGDVIHSMLDETAFQTQRGTGWILMDGRSVTGSEYETLTGDANVPDSRGIVLRGKNNGRSAATGNQDGEVALGTFQADEHKSHTHIQQSHVHTTRLTVGGGSDPAGNAAVSANALPNVGSGSTVAINNNTGGNETRMRNVTVIVFVRID